MGVALYDKDGINHAESGSRPSAEVQLLSTRQRKCHDPVCDLDGHKYQYRGLLTD